MPREKPANYAWLSHAIHQLAPSGRAGIVMPKVSLTSTSGDDDKLRANFIEEDIVECIIDLPARLFFNTPIQCSLWFLNKNKSKWKTDRTNQILFIDARKLGRRESKTQTVLDDHDISKISTIFNSWTTGTYEDLEGFCKSVDFETVQGKNFSLVPSVYIDNGMEVDDEVLEFEDEIEKLSLVINHQFQAFEKVAKEIRIHLQKWGS